MEFISSYKLSQTTDGHKCEVCNMNQIHFLTRVNNKYICDNCMRKMGLGKYIQHKQFTLRCIRHID